MDIKWFINKLLLILRLLEFPAVLMILIACLAVNGRDDPHVMPKAIMQISIAGACGVLYFLLAEGLFYLIKRYKEKKEARIRNQNYIKYRDARMVDKQKVINIVFPYWVQANRDGQLGYREMNEIFYTINNLKNGTEQ